MAKPKILLQLDADPQPSVFDSVVAIDSDVEQLFRHGNVTPADVQGLVHGCIFTRGIDELSHTAIFVGGSDVGAGEALLAAVTKTFFGPMRVSVMMDANGSNTTAAAAVLAAARHLPLEGAEMLVLAATGPVGRRVVRLLAQDGARVRVASRNLQRSEALCQELSAAGLKHLTPHQTSTPDGLLEALAGVQGVIAAGAAAVELLPLAARQTAKPQVAIDLNAVPPLGIAGIEPMDRGIDREGTVCYGAIGVGATKMKIHKAAVRKLFTSNKLVLDANEIYALGQELEK